MRLIQPTLLLLLLAIHGESCVLSPGSGNSQEDKKKEILMKCLAEKCPKEEAACKNKPNCMGYFECVVKYCSNDKVNCYKKCGPDYAAQQLFQCSVDQECISHTQDTCPGESDKDKKKPDNPELVAQLTGNTWLGMYTTDNDTDHGFLNYPCLKLDFSGNGENTSLEYSNCHGDSRRGICSTNITTTNGNGKQRGNRQIIDLKLAKKDFLLNSAYITIYVHTLVKGKFAFVSICFKDDINVFSSKVMVISPFRTVDEMARKSTNPEATKKQFFDAINENYNPFYYPMEARRCKN